MASGISGRRVVETADDAAASKLSAIKLGYVADAFMPLLVKRGSRRSPLINRGYYARMASVDLIARRFVAIAHRNGERVSQIVSLGAGLDTTFFKLWADDAAPSLFLEVDFPDITARKTAAIRAQPALRECVAGHRLSSEALEALIEAGAGLPASPGAGGAPAAAPAPGSDGAGGGIEYGPVGATGVAVRGPHYRLVTADLRDIAALQAALRAAGIDTAAPTLFLSECVLVYLEPEESCAIIAWAAHEFARSVFVTYEQIRPFDAFGQVMARNMEERGYNLRGLHAFPDIAAQTARYRELGYAACTVADMNDVYYRLLPHGDVARVERLELFDEVEEWHLMSAHYCIAIAVNDKAAAAPYGEGIVTDQAPLHAHAAAPAAAAASDTSATPHIDVVSPAAAAAAATPPGASGGESPSAPAAALTPRELAVAVVAAHTAAEATASAPRSPARGGVSSGHIGGRSHRSPMASASGGHTSTSGGVTVVSASGAVDFAAIAEAEDELSHAKHVREAVGMDALRGGPVPPGKGTSSSSSGSGSGSGGGAAVATAAGSAAGVLRRDSRGSGTVGSGAGAAAAPDGASARSRGSAGGGEAEYDVASILAAPVPAGMRHGHGSAHAHVVPLSAMLLPLAAWTTPHAASAFRG